MQDMKRVMLLFSSGTCYYLFPSQRPMKILEDATDIFVIFFTYYTKIMRALKFDL